MIHLPVPIAQAITFYTLHINSAQRRSTLTSHTRNALSSPSHTPFRPA